MTERPRCPDCDDRRLVCVDCDEQRPKAEDLYQGWRLLTPFGRWETVTDAKSVGPYGPVVISTKETPGYPWRYYASERVTATPPEQRWTHGTPEIRVIEYTWSRDAPMYVIATTDSSHNRTVPLNSPSTLVQASFRGSGQGWGVQHRPDPMGDAVTIECPNKAKARSTMRALAREYAKKMGVKVRIAE